MLRDCHFPEQFEGDRRSSAHNPQPENESTNKLYELTRAGSSVQPATTATSTPTLSTKAEADPTLSAEGASAKGNEERPLKLLVRSTCPSRTVQAPLWPT
eukprot:6199995-Pleurochrysis_carterae.AAC.2